MQIRKLYPAENPADLAAALPAFQTWAREFTPGFPDLGEARLRLWAMDRYRERRTVLGAFADESAVEAEGLAFYGFELTKNLDMTWAELQVPAEAQARGVDSALFAEAMSLSAANAGRKRLAVALPETADPASFAARHGGGKYADTAIRSALDLSTIDRARYAAWAAPSAKNGEYTLVRWIDRCPDEFAESYCAVQDAMADQPMGEFQYEFAVTDIERLRFDEERTASVGARKYVQAAVDPDGNVAGFSAIAAYPDEPEVAEIWDTGVARQHRGHGLGLRLKAAASRWLLEDRPSTRWVHTFNNNENEWMLHVNRTLGYRPAEDWLGYDFAVTG